MCVVFMDLLNRVFKPYLDLFVTIFNDEKLICSRNEEDHTSYLITVHETQKDKDMYVKFSKCEFELNLWVLGHIVSGEGIRADTQKIYVVQSCLRPTSPTDIRSFLSLVSYYRRFVEGFSSTSSHLTQFTQMTIKFQWFDSCGVLRYIKNCWVVC